ncbi:MAG TPA: ABC transporter permease [Candidatus Eisenbacteria bacterium]|nr:ABC transporter permease [Candidatus Eisenbacteria bacterium]
MKALLRILALAGKEIVEVFRRPGAVLSLVLGPFLILAVFGFGYHGVRRELQAILVVAPTSGLPTTAEGYKTFETRGVTLVDVVQDRAAAEQRLRTDEIDLVIIAPSDPQASFKDGRHSELTVEINVSDPVQANYAGFLAETLAADVNAEIYRLGVAAGEGYVLKIAGEELANIPAEVIASPTRAVTINLAPSEPGIVAFYGPAALALVLQHMAVTLLALSIVRERTSGAMELFRVSPLRATELVIGKVLAFGLLGSFLAAVSMALLIGVLGVPMLSQPVTVAGVVALLLLASLGLGLLISAVSDSERQAVQLSLLALLASMFFSGFVLRIDEFERPVQIAAYALPVTHGISLLQDLLLRGAITHPWQVGALAVLAAVLLLSSWALLRRDLRPS